MLWYLLHVAMHRPAAQKCGLVVLVNARGGSPAGYDPTFAYRSSCFARFFPLRFDMTHVCYASAVVPLIAKALKMAAPNMKDSLALHNGSEQRVLACLKKHHLPQRCVPVDMGESRRTGPDDPDGARGAGGGKRAPRKILRGYF